MLSMVNPDEPLGLFELFTVVIISGGGDIGARGNVGSITENGGEDLGGCYNFGKNLLLMLIIISPFRNTAFK